MDEGTSSPVNQDTPIIRLVRGSYGNSRIEIGREGWLEIGYGLSFVILPFILLTILQRLYLAILPFLSQAIKGKEDRHGQEGKLDIREMMAEDRKGGISNG